MADQQRAMGLLDDDALAGCAVVANCEMNRQRQLGGVNSYARELGFDPVEVLTAEAAERRADGATVAWLDLCCGSGRALIQAVDRPGHLASIDDDPTTRRLAEDSDHAPVIAHLTP